MKTQRDLEKLQMQNKTEIENESDYVSVSVSPKFIGIILTVVAIIVILTVVFINNERKKTTSSNMDHNDIATETVENPTESVEKIAESSINNGTIESEIQESLDDQNNTEPGVVEVPSDENQQNKGILSTYENLLKSGSDSGDLYITGNIVVGKGKDVEPGVYDMTFLGGKLNGYINHPEFGLIFYGNNEVVRLILTEGIQLEASEVSKVKFTAVKKEDILSEFKQGYYLVGKDIKPGKYLVGINGKLGRGFWSIRICSNEESGNYRTDIMQTYDSENTDIAIDLKEGNILCLSCDKWECIGNLVLTELN